MPCKSSGETFVWNPVKEKRLLEKLDEFLSFNSGRQPTIQIYDLWAQEFNVEFGGVYAYGLTLYQKKERMKKVYRGWKVLQAHTGLGYDPATDRVVCSDEAWQSFIKVHKECKHLHYEGLCNKELYYNVFEKTHATGASGYGSITMGGDNTSYVDYDFNFDNSETYSFLEEDPTLSTGGRQATTRQRPDVAGPSRETYHLPEYRRRRGGLGNHKEVFNYTHSSLRNYIERTFGVWKAIFKILKGINSYPMDKQVMIPVACAVLHNFIRMVQIGDPLLEEYAADCMLVTGNGDVNTDYEFNDIFDGTGPSTGPQLHDSSRDVINQLRDMMADEM